MVFESVQLSRLTNAEAENSFHEWKDQHLHQGSKGRQGNIGPVGISTCLDAENSGKKKARHNQDMTLQDLYNDEVDFSDDDGDWEPVQGPTTEVGSVGATTCLDFEDSGKVSGTCARDTTRDCNVNSQQEKKANRHKDMTLQDMFIYEDSDDNDSDWEPLQEPAEIAKWFCVNCTMVNFEDVVHCDICGEHRESEILKHGFFASPFKGLPGSKLDVQGILEGGCT